MGNPETPFDKLLASQLTDKDRQYLHGMRDRYGLKGSDAMWCVLMLFQNNVTHMERIPAKIEEAARNATEATRVTAEAQAKAAQATMEHAATKAIERVAIDCAKKVAGAWLLKWISVAVVAICGALVVMHRLGISSGHAEGANAARALCEKDMTDAAWVRSPEGQVAYALAKSGSIRNVAVCDQPGWEVQDGQCIVRPDHGTIYGWHVPEAYARQTPRAQRARADAKNPTRCPRGRSENRDGR